MSHDSSAYVEIPQRGANRVRLSLKEQADPVDPYSCRRFRVELRSHRLTAVGAADEFKFDTLAQYIRSLAVDWRGWDGEKAWRSEGHKLRVSATHDGKGHVELRFELDSDLDPEWTASLEVYVDSGEELTRIAEDLDRLFAG